MSLTARHYISGIVTFCIGVVLIIFLRSDNSTQLIKDRIQAAVDCATFEAELPVFEKMDLAKRCAAMASEIMQIELHTSEEHKSFTKSRDEIKKGYLALRSSFNQLASRASNLNIKVKSARATAKFNLRIMGREPGREDYFLEDHPIEVELIKEEGEWLISKIRNLDEIALD